MKSLERRVRSLAESRGAIYVLAALCLLFLASDFVAATNQFWSGHQVLTSVATNAALAFVTIAVLDRLVAIRDAKRWRPLGLFITDRLGLWVTGLEETLQAHVFDYCQRTYGDCEVPEGRDYLNP